MKKGRYSEEQIIGVLKQMEVGSLRRRASFTSRPPYFDFQVYSVASLTPSQILHRALTALARQKPRYGYRRLTVLLEKRGFPASPQRVYRIYREEHLAVRRLKRKRLLRPAPDAAAERAESGMGD